ncbi:MAG: hypothetical protein OXC18_23750 [Desulfurellaceae bacterium]|nr:hypothetical protein [Desulfurellaceae bacterium]
MAVSQELLTILVCPETKQPVALAPTELVDTLNAHIQNGSLKNRMGEVVSAAMDAALVREDQRYCYPIRDDIPVMLIDEAIPLPSPGESD